MVMFAASSPSYAPGIVVVPPLTVLDERRHPRGLRAHLGHGLPGALGQPAGQALDQFGVAGDRGQRGPQLVAGVGDELAQP
ncbi:hypothetical protein MF406_11115 [Georgenia sp. TF02-10]|uniref:hypothetical protein n=1 Tax=Georgenia sp. TF02-10 TaxID=2917725 RepID=UPI001FA70882|nr:hypothetical protein [Georgenia sp. TF02-10]UNX53540.1 hypothetical protein MF406_11115 [Georgenia sp. TF02-10]